MSSLEQSPGIGNVSIDHRTIYAGRLMELAQKLKSKEARWAIILGTPNQVVLPSSSDMLREQVIQDFETPMIDLNFNSDSKKAA